MRAEQKLHPGARTVALSSSGRPESIHQVDPAHSMLEEHSFAVDASGQRVAQKKKKQSLSAESRYDSIQHRVEAFGDCKDNPDDPLCAGQNRSNVVDVKKEIDLTEQMIGEVSLYCCCGDAAVSSIWQEQLRKGTVPGYCKKSWYNQYCTGLDSQYSPSEAALNQQLGRQKQIQMCDVCNECFQKKCPFWAEDQQPMTKRWIDTITCKDATTPVAQPEPEIKDLEARKELAEADACSQGSIKCPSNIQLALQEFPIVMFLLFMLFVAQCGAGAFYIKYRYQAAEDLKGGEEQEPILDPSLVADIDGQEAQ